MTMKNGIAVLFLLAGATLVHAVDGDITLNGSFVRGGNSANKKTLKATLTSNGEGVYKVTWVADWNGKPNSFVGELKGDLKNGDITGTATDKSGKRTWRVAGKAAAGVLTFDHFETTKGHDSKTGTGTLQ